MPFWGSVMMRDFIQDVGHSPVCQILLQILRRILSLSPTLMYQLRRYVVKIAKSSKIYFKNPKEVQETCNYGKHAVTKNQYQNANIN